MEESKSVQIMTIRIREAQKTYGSGPTLTNDYENSSTKYRGEVCIVLFETGCIHLRKIIRIRIKMFC
jgi:hypothetical protein